MRNANQDTILGYVEELWDLLVAQKLQLPPMDQTFPLEQVVQALEASITRAKVGKSMLVDSTT